MAGHALQSATLLDDVHWRPNAPISASSSYQGGVWTVKIRRDLKYQPEHLIKFQPEDRFTFGIALNGANNPGAGHWVSLPMTLTYDGEDSVFRVK